MSQESNNANSGWQTSETDRELEAKLAPDYRYATVKRFSQRPGVREVKNYLPVNYEVVYDDDGLILIRGVDKAGWTLDDYVIPRLGSGLITAREISR
jgi:hypothetical protein